jgi:hypothetical protein
MRQRSSSCPSLRDSLCSPAESLRTLRLCVRFFFPLPLADFHFPFSISISPVSHQSPDTSHQSLTLLFATHPRNPQLTEHPTRMRVLRELCEPKDLSFHCSSALPLSPVFATDPRKRPITPFLATLPKTRSRKSNHCHTYDPSPCRIYLPARLGEPHMQAPHPGHVAAAQCHPEAQPRDLLCLSLFPYFLTSFS